MSICNYKKGQKYYETKQVNILLRYFQRSLVKGEGGKQCLKNALREHQ